MTYYAGHNQLYYSYQSEKGNAFLEKDFIVEFDEGNIVGIWYKNAKIKRGYKAVGSLVFEYLRAIWEGTREFNEALESYYEEENEIKHGYRDGKDV